MGELIVREVDPAIIEKLKERAEQHSRSIEDEHKEILREVLLPNEQKKHRYDVRAAPPSHARRRVG